MPTKISAIGLAVTAILIIAFVNGFIPQQPSPYEDVEWKSFKGYSYAVRNLNHFIPLSLEKVPIALSFASYYISALSTYNGRSNAASVLSQVVIE